MIAVVYDFVQTTRIMCAAMIFLETRTSKGRKMKILNIIDKYTRECLTSYAAFRIRSDDVKNILRDVMWKKGTPEYLRSDNGSEFIAKHLQEWLSEIEVSPMYIMPGSPWENGYVELFNRTMANKLLNIDCKAFLIVQDCRWEVFTRCKKFLKHYLIK